MVPTTPTLCGPLVRPRRALASDYGHNFLTNAPAQSIQTDGVLFVLDTWHAPHFILVPCYAKPREYMTASQIAVEPAILSNSTRGL